MNSNPHPPEFNLQLASLIKARFPLLYIPTWEEERALVVIQSVVMDTSLIKTHKRMFVWSMTAGLSTMDGQSLGDDTRDPIKALDTIDSNPETAIYILKDFHVYFNSNSQDLNVQAIRKLRDLLPRLKQHGKTLILLSPSLILPQELLKDVHVLEFSLPTFEDLKTLLVEMIVANRKAGHVEFDLHDDVLERLVKAALGLTYQEAENAFAFAMANNGRLNGEDVPVIIRHKHQVIRKTGTLEFVESGLNLDDIGGLENLKDWLTKRNRSWLDSARRYGLPAPKGILVTGVPGCGKSLLAKAISSVWHLPLLRFDLDKIFSPYVGTSEENMRKAILVAEALAPSILWIDEIEKGFAGSRGELDGGTACRVFGSFLTWMQEKQKPVFVVATANNIQSLPTELLRKGRFDEIFFVDLPAHNERQAIFRIHLEKRLHDPFVAGDFQLNDAVLDNLAGLTPGFIGSEIEQIVLSGLFEAFSEDRSLRLSDLEFAIEHTVPLSVTQAEQVQGMRNWARTRAISASHNPEIPAPSDTPVAPAFRPILPGFINHQP